MTNISWEHVKTVCNPGSPATCSFLLMGPGGWMCAKSEGNEGFYKILTARRSAVTIKAMGDNCEGWDSIPRAVAVNEVVCG